MLQNFLITIHVSTFSGSNWIEVFRGQALSFPSMITRANEIVELWNYVLNNGKPLTPSSDFVVAINTVDKMAHHIVDLNTIDVKYSCLLYEKTKVGTPT